MSSRRSVMTAARIAVVVLAAWAMASAAAQAAQVSTGGSGWMWSDPAPQGETLSQVAFTGAVGYAVGAGGTVLRSEDGGHDWTGLTSGTDADLTMLDEVDANTIVVGGHCAVRESTDGGASFHRLAVDASEASCPTPVASVSFLSATNGYVEQADGTVLVTSDGGQTIQQRTAVPLNGGTAEQIYFRSASVGFAVVSDAQGGRIYRTTDGAGSWTQVGASKHSEPLFGIYFASPSVLYAVGGGQAPVSAPGYNDTVVLLSEDEGKTWGERTPESQISSEKRKSVTLPEGAPPLALRQIACSDPLDCVIATGTKSLIETADGTVTGTLVTPSEAAIASVAFSTALNVVGVGEGGATVLSSDGGLTFPTTISHHLGGEFTTPVRAGASAQYAYMAGKAGQLAASTDGGGTWGALQVPTSADLADVAFPAPQIGYAVSASGIVYRTPNGGQSWSILDDAGEAPSRMLAASANTILLLGPTGIRRSGNGGGSFASVGGTVVVGHRHHRAIRRRLSAFPLFAGAEQVDGASIAWGDEAIESTDGGSRWTLIPRPLKEGVVEGLSFVSATEGYEISRQRLFFTRNAGRSWSEISSLGIQPAGGEGDMSFSSAADGYVIGAFEGKRDVILRTSDAGRTWTPEALPRGVESVTAAGAVDYARSAGALFTTRTGGIGGSSSSLSLSIAGPRRISRAKQHKAHGRVKLKGELSPAAGGAKVIVSFRNDGRSAWTHRSVTAASSGAFSLTITGVASSTEFVAQWAGEAPTPGAGSAAVTLTVTRR